MNEELVCAKCALPLGLQTVNLAYLNNNFSVELPRCPGCGMVFVAEGLATGRMLEVEQSLEDK